MLVRKVRIPDDGDEWLRMRLALFPEHDPSLIARELDECAAGEEETTVFVAEKSPGRLGGFLELSLRSLADGCEARPIPYIEAWYVDPEFRRSGVGRALVVAAEKWARQAGYKEIASDCEIENEVSRQAHVNLGYQEALRLIHFRKSLENSV